MTADVRQVRRGPLAAVVAALVTVALATLPATGASANEPAGVSGEAYGHYTKVGLFGGPPAPIGPSPSVSLPTAGVDAPLTDGEPQGASAVYGPATIFGGRWPPTLASAPASGPVKVSTVGSPGRGGSVTSEASITLHPKPLAVACDGAPPGQKSCTSPGGFGPVVPNEGDELHARCTADEKGVTGSTRIVNGILTTSTDAGGEPKDREPIPERPEVNYTRTGVITNVGDSFRVVYNEQIVDPDGSITVNAVHMYLLGPIAVGEQILGHVRCSMKPAATSPTTGLAFKPTKTAPPSAASAASAGSSSAGSDGLPPLAFAGGALVAVLATAALLVARRRRRVTADAGPPAPPG